MCFYAIAPSRLSTSAPTFRPGRCAMDLIAPCARVYCAPSAQGSSTMLAMLGRTRRWAPCLGDTPVSAACRALSAPVCAGAKGPWERSGILPRRWISGSTWLPRRLQGARSRGLLSLLGLLGKHQPGLPGQAPVQTRGGAMACAGSMSTLGGQHILHTLYLM